jgi:hypothetical protein
VPSAARGSRRSWALRYKQDIRWKLLTGHESLRSATEPPPWRGQLR